MNDIQESISEGGMSIAGASTRTGASDDEELYEELEQLMNEMALSQPSAVKPSSAVIGAAVTRTPTIVTPSSSSSAATTTVAAVVRSSSEERVESTQRERRLLTPS